MAAIKDAGNMGTFRDEMTPLERLTAVLEGKPYDRVPCGLTVSNQAGKLVGINHWECYFSAQKTAETQIAAYKIFGVESVVAGPGLQGIAEAAGSRVFYPKEENTQYIIDFAVKEAADLENLEIISPWKSGRLAVHLEALKILIDQIGNTVPVVSNVAGAFTTAANIRGTENFLRDLYKNPAFAHKLLKFSLDSTLSYIKEAANLGAKISIAEPTASTTLISPKQFREFAFPYLRQLVAAIFAQTGSRPSLHICGNTKRIWKDMADTDAGILSLDDTIDLAEAKEAVGQRVTLFGNVKPTEIMLLGTPEDVWREAKACLKKAGDSPKGYILSLGCGLPMKAPVENIQALFQAARKFGRYPFSASQASGE